MKDLGESYSGISIESSFNKTGKYKVISIGSYSEESKYVDQGLRVNHTERTRDKILNKDDLTMVLNDKTLAGRIIGRVLLIDKDDSYAFNQRTQRIIPEKNKFNSQFIYQLLNAPNNRNKIILQSQGNTQIYVNWSAISETEYFIPEVKEQEKIGELFYQLDNLITLHQRKYIYLI